ncbi:MAG: hypothetical protein F6K19_27670 [Cyanothece sp. SIO1E1]|nr:hypothetical protein [Cyanothece sp. SIO1E1]
MKWVQFNDRKTWLLWILTGVLATTTLVVIPTPSAQAQSFLQRIQTLFGRRGQQGRASGRVAGGAVRTGRNLGGNNPNIPYVISPRNTWLENDSFTIRWQPVSNATRYTVRLWRWSYGEDQREALLWETEVEATQVEYSGQPPLEAGPYYSIEVIADTGASSNSDAGAAKTGFELLFPEDLEILQADLADLTDLADQELTAEAQTLVLASIYFRENLLANAIHTLEPLVETGTQNPLVYQALGEIYSYTGLNTLAQRRYGQAITLATASAALEDSTLASLGLAEVNATLEEWDQAILLFRQAESGFEALGDTNQAARIRKRIDFIETFQ